LSFYLGQASAAQLLAAAALPGQQCLARRVLADWHRQHGNPAAAAQQAQAAERACAALPAP
jgi:hypothetical protein